MNIYVDIDGVLAVSQPIAKYTTKGIFKRLPAITGSHYFLDVLKSIAHINGSEIIALTKTFTPDLHEEQTADKIFWIDFNFANIFDDVICVHPSKSKTEVLKSCDILIDDYGKNCREWISAGGIAIQMFEDKSKKEFITVSTYGECLAIVNQILKGDE